MTEPLSTTALVNTPVVKAVLGSLSKSLAKNIGKVARPIIDHAVVDLQIGFNSYLEASYNKCRYFKTILNQSEPLEVTSYYIHNYLSCGGKRLKDDTLINNVKKIKHVVVTGLAGSGKSMFMKYLTICNFENNSGVIPLFIELRQLNSISKKDIIEFIRASCTASGHSVSSDQFALALSAGAFTIILDGFDELNHEFRDDISKQIMDITKKYPETSIVVSSRHDDRFFSWTSFHVYNVEKMTKQQSLSLISSLKYDQGVKKRFHREVKDRLYDSHESFLSSPLLTTIMLLTFEEFAEIPVKMHSFYGQAFDTLFQKHDASKEQYQRKTHTGLGRDDFKATFSAFCAMSYLEQKFSFEDDKLISTAESAVNYIKQSRSDISKLLNKNSLISDLKESVCLLQQDGLETAFVHRSFQEYFAALFATSLHGEKVKKVIDKYSLRFGDSVVMMAMDMDRETIEQEWVLPTIEYLTDRFMLNENSSTSSERLKQAFESILFYRTNGHIYTTYLNVNYEVLGRFQTLCAIYPRALGESFIVKPFIVNLSKALESIVVEENSRQNGFSKLKRIMDGEDDFPSSSIKKESTTFQLSKNNDWWLNHLGVGKMFDDISKSFKAIRRDIESREVKRKDILQDFL